MYFAVNFMIVPGMFVCSSFIISVCNVYVYSDESFAHIECYTDYSRRGAIWLNPLVTVLFNVCCIVTA